jgi:hypothetical protein
MNNLKHSRNLKASDKLKRPKKPRDLVNPRGPQLRENLKNQGIKKNEC